MKVESTFTGTTLRLTLCFHVLAALLTLGCEPNPTQEIQRPIEPWALRSVLDYRPRMITLALDSELYVAYDLQQCGLYKAWKGGVKWEGIVYTDTKTMQPAT